MYDLFYNTNIPPQQIAHAQYASDIQEARELSKTEYFWYLSGYFNLTDFDFGVVPPSWEWNHVYVWPSQWQRNSGLYLANKWDQGPLNYRTDQTATRLPDKSYWHVPANINHNEFDYSWHPDPDENFIHLFGTQWQPDGGPEYHTPGATELKYEAVQKAHALPTKQYWFIPENILANSFDYSWHPRRDENFTHLFGTQWQPNGGPEYRTPGATELKYENVQRAQTLDEMTNWIVPDYIDVGSFDFSWRPRTDENFIHVFGTQWQPDGGPEYHTPGATELKYETGQKAHAIATEENWKVPDLVDRATFDFSWHPRRAEKFTHVFGTQWQPDGGPEYVTQNSIEKKYETVQKCVRVPSLDNWYVPDYIDLDQFDFSWHPRNDDLFVHIFGTQWHNSGGPEYRHEDAKEVKYENCQRATSIPQPDRWEIPNNVELDNFDLSWHPPRGEEYVHVFGTKWAREGGPKYITDSAKEVKYQTAQQVRGKITTDIFVIDRYNQNAQQSYDSVLKHDKKARKIRGVGTWRDIIRKACENSTGDFVWIASSDYDYTDFDFSWFPENWQSNMIHVFGSRHNKWANVFRVPRHEYLRLAPWFDDIKDFPELNFVEDQTVQLFDDNREIWYVDFGNSAEFAPALDYKKARFFGNWLDTLKRIAERTDNDYVWVCGSVCDYTDFDFGWEPEPWQQDMLHVFPSNQQVEGDTFLLPVQKYKEQMDNLKVLGWFETVNYVKDISVDRCGWPVVNNLDELQTVYGWLLRNTQDVVEYDPPFWKKPELHVFNTSGSVSLVPRDSKSEFKTQFYDYPYILRHKGFKCEDKPLDVVYLSNGEKNAEKNWNRLLELCPNAKRIDGVNGRALAYKACAEISDTEWFINVFAKCWVHDDFNFGWQPDYLQNTKHYIFDAYNPVTDMTYGHMGIIAYHKQLVLDCTEWGLDFTLSMPHGTVPVTGSTADYANTPYETWRTSFREVVKLTQQEDVQSKYRLDKWLSTGLGDMGEWSKLGARDAIDFVSSGKDLQLSFEWGWLEETFNSLHNS